MPLVREQSMSDATRLRQKGLRVTGPRLAILSTLDQVGGHRAVDELVLALHRAGYHHARTTVYNALDDLARAGLVRAAPVDAGALRYEAAGPAHHHFVCRRCGVIRNVGVAGDLIGRSLPSIEGAEVEELDVVYRGRCAQCVEQVRAGAPASLNRGSSGFPEHPGEYHAGDHAADHAGDMAAHSGGYHGEGPRDDRPLGGGEAGGGSVDLRERGGGNGGAGTAFQHPAQPPRVTYEAGV
jgi:Fe2+ or Zn2+ uptake regulation protein